MLPTEASSLHDSSVTAPTWLVTAVCEMRRQPPVEPIDVREEHVYACFDALLAHLNGTDAPAVPFQDALWHVSLSRHLCCG
jgi:hypothetical protein